eukprot:jgi/Phyca11/14530/fgenesh1_pg.PHYCAscaffold_8_\
MKCIGEWRPLLSLGLLLSAVGAEFFTPEDVPVEVARRVDEVQTFSVAATGPILAGGYTITFKNDLGTETTSCIAWDASEVEFEMALEELPNVDSVGVSRSAYSATKNGYVYTVTFDGAYLVLKESGRIQVLL